MKQYGLLLMDMDETLFDFLAAEEFSIVRTFARCGLPHTEVDLECYRTVNTAQWKLAELGFKTTDQVKVDRFKEYLAATGYQGDPETLSKTYVEELSESAFLIDGAKELMEYLHLKYKICIVTNGIKYNQYRRMEKAGLMPLCDGMAVSEEVGASKPSPLIFEKALELVGYTDKGTTLMIGDNLSADIGGGNQFGCDTLWYNPKSKENKSGIVPTYEVKDYSDIRAML